MNEALRRFKEDRPEEYQEYRGYQRKYQQLNVRFIGACTVALSVVVGSYFLWGIVPALVLAVIAYGRTNMALPVAIPYAFNASSFDGLHATNL
jgi:hypothetical protein